MLVIIIIIIIIIIWNSLQIKKYILLRPHAVSLSVSFLVSTTEHCARFSCIRYRSSLHNLMDRLECHAHLRKLICSHTFSISCSILENYEMKAFLRFC